jgi:hypothetical protein
MPTPDVYVAGSTTQTSEYELPVRQEASSVDESIIQYVKIVGGAVGTDSGPNAPGVPFYVSIVNLGQQLAAASVPIVLTALQLSALTPPAAITNYAQETGGNLATVATNTAKIPSLGQALAAASVPVVLTASQLSTLTPLSSVAITGSVAVTGTFWQTTQGVNLSQVGGASFSLGQQLSTASVPVVLTASQLSTLTPLASVSITGSVAVTGTVTANAGSGTFANNLSQVGGTSFSLGQQLAATSLPIVLTASQLSTLTPLSSVAITGSVAVTGTFYQTTQGVNLSQVGGSSFSLGQQLSTASLPVVLTASQLSALQTVSISGSVSVTFASNVTPSYGAIPSPGNSYTATSLAQGKSIAFFFDLSADFEMDLVVRMTTGGASAATSGVTISGYYPYGQTTIDGTTTNNGSNVAAGGTAVDLAATTGTATGMKIALMGTTSGGELVTTSGSLGGGSGRSWTISATQYQQNNGSTVYVVTQNATYNGPTLGFNAAVANTSYSMRLKIPSDRIVLVLTNTDATNPVTVEVTNCLLSGLTGG